MRILQYQGISVMSRLIRWQTRSKYSHTAIELNDGRVVEAWSGGVRVVGSFEDQHTPGTKVNVFDIVTHGCAFDEGAAEEWLLDQVGKGYDYWSVARFVSRRKAPSNDKWFCSELALYGIAEGGLMLLHGNYSEMSPRDVPMSPFLFYAGQWVVGRDS